MAKIKKLRIWTIKKGWKIEGAAFLDRLFEDKEDAEIDNPGAELIPVRIVITELPTAISKKRRKA